MPTIIKRGAWGARPARSVSYAVRDDRYKVHWTDDCSGTSQAAERAHVRGIQNFHMDVRGWSDIAYNFLIGPSGLIYEGRGHGVRSAANGNWLLNYNHMAVAVICGERCGVNTAQLESLGWFLREFASKDVRGHRDGYPTTCPGDVIYRWLQRETWKEKSLTELGPSYWTWRAWRCSLGPWTGKGRKEEGAKYRPRIPRKGSPKWPVWWTKFAKSGGCG